MSNVLEETQAQYRAYQSEKEQASIDGNPRAAVLRLALSMHARFEGLTQDTPLTVEDLDQILRDSKDKFVGFRIQNLALYHGNVNEADSLQSIEETIRGLTKNGDKTVSPEQFQQNLTHIYNAVYTGHPVFSMHPNLREAMAQKASILAGSTEFDPVVVEQKLQAALEEVFEPLSLDQEHAESMVAIMNMRAASDEIVKVAMKVAQETYPDQWQNINYAPTITATWNPFDWDGRADVKWPKIMERTTELLIDGLGHYEPQFSDLAQLLDGEDREQIKALMKRIQTTRDELGKQWEFYASYDQDKDVKAEGDTKVVLSELAAFENEAIKNRDLRIRHKDELAQPLQAILDRHSDGESLSQEAREKLVVLRSNLENHGLSIAKKHYRINADSLLTALANTASDPMFDETIITTADNGSQLTRINLAPVNRLLANASPEEANLGDLAEATETVARQMIAIRQELDELDQSGGPVRFLIAEADSAIIPLAALFYAKKFGVDNQIDISPLIEDEAGIEYAKEMFRELLRNEHYCEYIKQRGRFCVQFGYSDSGRFLGQPAAASQLEKVQGQMIDALREAGLDGVGAVIFDTNGEWMGRGAHPKSFEDRLEQLKTPFILNRAKNAGIHLEAEGAFQGQDGYLHQGTKALALSSLAKGFKHMTADHSNIHHDPMYDFHRSKGDVLAFIETAGKQHLKFAKEDPEYAKDYAEMIARYGAFMPKTGSRPVKRAGESGGERDLPRAIPHNSILKALGIPDNLLDGLGTAVERDPEMFENLMILNAVVDGIKSGADGQEQFKESMKGSKAFRNRMYMVERAMDEAYPDAMQSYVELENPTFWRNLADATGDQSYRKVANLMDTHGNYAKFSKVVGQMRDNLGVLRSMREKLDLPDDMMKDPEYAQMMAEKSELARVNHAVRMNEMISIFKKLPDTPSIVAGRHDVTRDGVIKSLLEFNPEGLRKLKEIFPAQANGTSVRAKFDKPSTVDISTDYSSFWDSFIRPIEGSLNRMNEVSHNLIHANGAVG